MDFQADFKPLAIFLPKFLNHLVMPSQDFWIFLPSLLNHLTTPFQAFLNPLTKQQKIQEQELSKVASESGKSSEAYKRQQVRVNETAASLAKAKTQMTELDSSMKKANPSFLDRIKSKLTGVDKEANQTHRTFKEVFAGSFLGNALSNAVSNVTGQLKNTVSEGMALNAAVAKINARFKSMGMSAKDIRTLDKQIGNLKAQTNMTGDNVANLQTKMLNWSNIGRKGAMQIVQLFELSKHSWLELRLVLIL